ncbi:MAG: NAD(P)-dependent glycerol-3-phosphate dehydrogenase [Coriobacteriaceae bacterium]|nr:NAD(P)-dependent glycerol-3-phosphate dehydrogenase [Coriobacteriaceae bacterium]
MKVAVIGAGSWGTAVAHLLGNKGYDISLWSYRASTAEGINASHFNPDYLTDTELPASIVATCSFEEACEGSEAAVVVTPSSAVRETAEQMAPYVGADVPVVVLSKGVEDETGFTMVGVLADVLGGEERLAALCGPNHAEEIARKLPAASVVASSSEETACFFQDLFTCEYLRIYTSYDVVGVELCSAAKNIYAIANGVLAALHSGDNASATLMTRGLAEISRLVNALGGDARTCMGLAGMGDLVTTCTSQYSRNRTLGQMLAVGKTLEDFEEETHMVAEGAVACRTVVALAERNGVELPIADCMRRVLWEDLDPAEAARMLMSRPKKSELEEG